MQTIEQIEQKFHQVAKMFGANEHKIEKFLSTDNEDAEYAIAAIVGHFAHCTGNQEKAAILSENLEGLRTELVNLRNIRKQMASAIVA